MATRRTAAAPAKSVFAPSAAAVLERMARTENSPESDWTKEDRCAFARSFKSLLCHRLINERLQRRDLGGVAAYRDLFQPQIRAAMLASALPCWKCSSESSRSTGACSGPERIGARRSSVPRS